MSFPSLPARPPRLSGLAFVFVLGALLVGPLAPWHAGQSAAGSTSSSQSPVGQSATGSTPSWQWPVGPTRVIVRPFVAPATRYSAGHRGIDVAAAPGASVVSPAAGVVHFVGVVVDRPLVSVEHPGGLISSFEPVESALVEGATVRGGDVLGSVLAGHCPVSCLHFGLRLHGEYVSPLNYLGGIAPSVLLPTRPMR